MSLILKGIDLDEITAGNGYARLEIEEDGTVVDDISDIIIAQAIQIDRPHGRIGDLDGVIKQIDKSPTFASKYKGTARLFINAYSDGNTILEAEE